MMRRYIFFLLMILPVSGLQGEEGMWMPLFLEALNIGDMQESGLKLSAQDIYDINRSCLTDGVVIFGGGCTGEVISERGLVLTNHHCGLSYVQSHSSLANDYITGGFWAGSLDEELPNPGLTATFLKRIEDVTARVLEGTDGVGDESVRTGIVQANIDLIRDSVSVVEGLDAVVKGFFHGNEYYLFLYQVFSDIRLVGSPPSSVGKFGGDTDNWMWPRHTGDFALFRIYADSANDPVDYSPGNVPYRPEFHFPISLGGYEPGDFTMVLGYPGSTFQFLTSHGLRQITEISVPAMIRIRTGRMNIMQEAMSSDPGVRIQYTSKYARVTNAWKKWIGMLKGLERMGAVERKLGAERAFTDWVNRSADRQREYGHLMHDFDSLYRALEHYLLVSEYEREVVMAVELFQLISDLGDFSGERETEELKARVEQFFRDYHEPVDRKVFAAMMKFYMEDLPGEFHPQYLRALASRFRGDYGRMAEHVYKKSVFAKKQELLSLLGGHGRKASGKILRDPAFRLYSQFVRQLMSVDDHTRDIELGLGQAYRKYVRALREMHTGQAFYPDANFTMRITYGKIAGYAPGDAVYYRYHTTLGGIIEKDDPGIHDYAVPEKLKDLYREKDYGRYAEGDTMYVCFIAGNHTSGGNSGSPVLNAAGELIGVNFDRNWEGTMSDYMYDPEQCRNISLDIRYVLFIIDRFAGAAHLIREMTLVE